MRDGERQRAACFQMHVGEQRLGRGRNGRALAIGLADHDAQQGFDHCKSLVKAARLNGPGGVRVNKAGCLDRCAGGPVAVVYPEAVWYTYVDRHDIDEIVQSHLVEGKVVERLRLSPDVGR